MLGDLVWNPADVDPALDSRAATFENPTGERGAGGVACGGRKGSPNRRVGPGERVVLLDSDGPGDRDTPDLIGFYRWHVPDPIMRRRGAAQRARAAAVGIAERVDDYCATAYAYRLAPQAVPRVDLAAALADIERRPYEKDPAATPGYAADDRADHRPSSPRG